MGLHCGGNRTTDTLGLSLGQKPCTHPLFGTHPLLPNPGVLLTPLHLPKGITLASSPRPGKAWRAEGFLNTAAILVLGTPLQWLSVRCLISLDTDSVLAQWFPREDETLLFSGLERVISSKDHRSSVGEKKSSRHRGWGLSVCCPFPSPSSFRRAGYPLWLMQEP